MRSGFRPFRVTLAVLPTALVLAFMVAQSRDSGTLYHGQVALLEGQTEVARESFERLLWSPTRWREARTGLTLVHTLDGTAKATEVPVAEQLVGFQLPLLLHGALARGDFAATARLAEFAPEALFPEAGLYRAAAQLENGDTGAARELFAAIAAPLLSTGLGHRIDRALDSERLGAKTLVLDRNGTAAGHLDDLGRFELAPGVQSEWLPEAIRPLLAQAQKHGPATLRLSVDLQLSQIAREALGRYRGTIVLVEIETGDVLVAVSDDATLRRIGTPALEQFREPASIAKLITATAALRNGIDPDSEIRAMDCGGSLGFSSGTLWCPSSRGHMRGLEHALAVSCNTAFARLGERIGREDLLAEYRRFGFDRGSLDLPGSGHILHPDGDSRQLADLSIGLEATDITPLHAALLAAVFGNAGSMPRPRFVTAYDGRLGLSPMPIAQLDQESVADARWTATLRRAMRTVAAPGGTGAGLSPANWPVAMKTGTASEPGKGYHVNYIGVGPLPSSRIAFCVRVTHQRTSRRVNRAARSVTKALLAQLGRYVGHFSPPTETTAGHVADAATVSLRSAP